jgi:ferredoxin
MATLAERIPENATGKYYVDATCIDCDQCRALAPDFFGRNEDGLSYLIRQPVTPEEVALVEEALTACATSSIGSDGE